MHGGAYGAVFEGENGRLNLTLPLIFASTFFVKFNRMTANIARKTKWTLGEFAQQFGPIELHRPLSKEEFVNIANHNPDLRMEREPNGSVTLMSPVQQGTSGRETTLVAALYNWNREKAMRGKVHGANGTYDLPNGSTKMPDASWLSFRTVELGTGAKESYIQAVPDFVAEIRSSSDRLKKLQHKMAETWMGSGVRLAWLIDPYSEKVHIYRAGSESPEIVEGFSGKTLSGEDVLPGFELDLEEMK